MFDILFLAYVTTAGFTMVMLWSIYKVCRIRFESNQQDIYYAPLPSAPPFEENPSDV